MKRGRPAYDDILTPREWQVFYLLQEGLTNEQIAARMRITHNGAKYHVSQIISKLGVASREEAVLAVQRQRVSERVRVFFLPALFDGTRLRAMALAVAFGALVLMLGVIVLLLRDTGGSSSVESLVPSEKDLRGALLDFEGDPDSNEAQTFEDPWAYCSAIGTIDKPDYRYKGELQPRELVIAFARAANVPPKSPMWQGNTTPPLPWRCMDGALYACTYGVNIPCMGKVDFSTDPNDRLIAACGRPPPDEDPSRFGLPAATTGRVTAYRWECIDGVPTPVGPPDEADAQGFFVRFWYRLTPASTPDTHP